MAATWKHPELGTFKFDYGWVGTIKAPGFKAFAYDTGNGNAEPATGRYKLSFEAKDEKDLPSPELIQVAQLLLADQAAIVSLITAALWDEFNGRGPKSVVWWYGNLKEVAHAVVSGYSNAPKSQTLKSARDLLAVLRLYDISILKEQKAAPSRVGVNPFTKQEMKFKPRPYQPPSAELNFHAAFEIEHGLGVRTDGKSVLGVGYWGEVQPFQSK